MCMRACVRVLWWYRRQAWKKDAPLWPASLPALGAVSSPAAGAVPTGVSVEVSTRPAWDSPGLSQMRWDLPASVMKTTCCFSWVTAPDFLDGSLVLFT